MQIKDLTLIKRHKNPSTLTKNIKTISKITTQLENRHERSVKNDNIEIFIIEKKEFIQLKDPRPKHENKRPL